MRPAFSVLLFTLLLPLLFSQAAPLSRVQQKTADGILEGVVSGDGQVHSFKGIPFAAPPVGPLRWKPPQPLQPWTGVRSAAEFAPRAMQGRIYSDMVFRDSGPSEDCLYLNVWVPAERPRKKLPVMVWIYGGGFAAGGTSEPRQDGGNLSKKGVIVVSMGYRLGVFGFLAHPELSRESERNASGNYGIMDQIAALEWVRKNIAAFGGDPRNVTIFGESAGSSSVSVLMASPKASGLFRRAIGESGTKVSLTRPTRSLAEAGASAVSLLEKLVGTSSLAALRALPAERLIEATVKEPRPDFSVIVDGDVLPAHPNEIYGAGRQAHVPLLAGWNRDEGNPGAFLGKNELTVENYVARAEERFGPLAESFLRVYPASSDADVKPAVHDFAADDSIGHATWRWLEFQRTTGKSTVYRYRFDQTLPLSADAPPGAQPASPHAGEIEFVFRVLSSRDLPWQQEHRDVSELMAAYWTNFAKNGDPNGPGLPSWPKHDGKHRFAVMHFGADSAAKPDADRARYEVLNQRAPAK